MNFMVTTNQKYIIDTHQNERKEYKHNTKFYEKKARVAILTSEKIHFKTKTVTRDKEDIT